MFLDNKYTKFYFLLITKRTNSTFEGYGEWHHIIPKSLGGTNEKRNLVKLTAREHFIAHRLLTKMVTGNSKRSMIFASHVTSSIGKHKPNSRTIARIKEEYANELRGVARSEEVKKKISDTLMGFKVSDETKQKISNTTKGRPKSDAFKEQMSERLNDPERDALRREKISLGLKGKPRSEETKRKISETRRLKSEAGTLKTRWS